MAFPCDNPRFEYEGKVYSADELKARLKSLDLKTASQFVEGLTVVPEMPMSKTWHELAFKKILRHAAENGYDRVAWTRGETQAARYDLSKQVDEVRANKTPSGKFQISVKRKDATAHEAVGVFEESKLSDVVGKDLADKIIAESGGTFSGLDLKVGGEGMAGFYDRILPSFAQKYGRKWGSRVGEAKILDRDLDTAARQIYGRDAAYDTLPPVSQAKVREVVAKNAVTAHGIDITPEMRRSVTQEGQPLFQGERAATKFLKDGRAVIQALDNPNVSSGAHEVHHVFAPVLAEATIKTPDAALKETGEAFFKWMGFDGADEFTKLHQGWVDGTLRGEAKARYVTGQEKGARGFERYLKTGEAPSAKLRQVFSDFKEWLTNIYGAVRGKAHPLSGKLSPEAIKTWDTVLGAPKGEYGKLIEGLHKPPSEGTPAFLENAQVKRALGLKPDASTADVRARLTEQIGKPRSSHLSPDDVSKWADSKGLQGAAREALDFATAKYRETVKAPTEYQQTGIRKSRYNPAEASISEAVRAMGGFRITADNRGEMKRLNFSSGLARRSGGIGVDEMVVRLKEDGYFNWDEDVTPSELLEMVESDARGMRRHYSSQREVDYEELYRQENPDESADALISLIETERGGILFDKVQDGTATRREIAEFKQLAADGGVFPDHVRSVIRDAKEKAATGLQDSAGRKPEEDFDFRDDPLDEGDKPPFLYQSGYNKPRQLGFVQEGLTQESANLPARERAGYNKSQAKGETLRRALGDDSFGRLRGLQESPVARIAVEVERRVTPQNAQNAPDVVAALSKLAELKRQKQTVDDFLNQGSLFGERELTPAQERILGALDKNPRRVIDEAFPAEKKAEQNLLFQDGETGGESKKTLVALHNLPAEGVLHAERMGGIPVPSIGITKKGSEFGGYGEVTLVGRKDLIDPEVDPRNKVFTADVYSGRQPRESHDFDQKKLRAYEQEVMKSGAYKDLRNSPYYELNDHITTYTAENRRARLVEDMARDEVTQLAFLRAKGEALPPKIKPTVGADSYASTKAARDFMAARDRVEYDTRPNEENRAITEVWLKGVRETYGDAMPPARVEAIIKSNLDEDGLLRFGVGDRFARELNEAKLGKTEVDTSELKGRVSEVMKGREDEFKAWVEQKVDGILKQPSYLQAGRKKQPYTLENVVDAMTDPKVVAKEKTMVEGLGKTRAATLKALKSIAEIKSHEGKLASEAEVNKQIERTQEAFHEWHGGMDTAHRYYSPGSPIRGAFDRIDDASRALADFVKMGGKTEAQMVRALRKNNYTGTIAPEVLRQGQKVARMVLDTPTAYFEAKPQRAVSLKEFAGAVLPEGAPARVIESLKRQGVTEIKFYKKGDEADRAAKIAEFEETPNVLFQSDHTAASRRQRAYRALLEAKGQGSLTPELSAPQPRRGPLGTAVNVANAIRALNATGEVSFLLRQGGVGFATHPVESARAARRSYRALRLSREGHKTFEAGLKEHPEYKLASESGLEMTDPSSKSRAAHEEDFQSDFVGRIPVVRNIEQATTSFLNAQRLGIFSVYAKQLRKAGAPPEAYKEAARLVNYATGRGDLGRLNQHAPLLTTVMFSPRYTASRFQLLNKLYNPTEFLDYTGASRAGRLDPRNYRVKPTARIQLKEATKYAGLMLGTLYLANQAGAEVSADPESPNFGKVKWGNRSYDITSGNQTTVRFLLRAAGALKRHATGEEAAKDKDVLDLAWNFLKTKAAPGVRTGYEVLKGEDLVTRNPTTPVYDPKGRKESTLLKSITPIFARELWQAMSRDGFMGLAGSSPSAVGIGVSDERDFQKPDTGRSGRSSSRPARPARPSR